MERLNWSVSHVIGAALLIAILGLVAYGIVYAATPSTFVEFTPHNNPIDIVAKTTNELLITEWCVPEPGDPSMFSVDSTGVFTPFGPSIRQNGGCLEEYLAISPGLGGFPPGRVYVTQGQNIYEFTPTGDLVGDPFATVPFAGRDHTGITFDQVGTFGYQMIVTGVAGRVYTIDSAGTVTLLAYVGERHESPEVIPVDFGPLGGQVWTAAENSHRVIATSPEGVVTPVDVTQVMTNADVIQLIPNSVCNFGDSGGALFVTDTFNNGGGGRIVKFPASDFTGLEGDVLVAGESGPIFRISLNPTGTGYVVSTFNSVVRWHEGATFALCPEVVIWADLAVTKTDSPDPVTVGNNLTYTVIVTNNGPWVATGVTLTDTLPAGVTFVSATPSQGSCSGTGTVTCTLGNLASGASTTVTIVVIPATEGTITNRAIVMGAQTDPNTANNRAAEDTNVVQLQPTPTPEKPSPAAVPEASTLFLLGSGLASLAGYAGLRLRARRRRDRK